MSIKRQLNPYSGMRIDAPHLRSIESSVCYDFDALLQGLVTGINQPYLLRGFDLVIPQASINASALEIKVADSAVLHASAAEAGTILLTPSTASNEILNSQNSKVIGAFQNGVINYLSLSYTRYVDPLTVDQTAGWSEAQKTEYQRTAPLGRVLDYKFNISTSGFGNNLPLYIVSTTSTGAVAYITKATPNLFRLGRGGSNPNPQYSYDFKYSNPQNPDAPRTEWVNDSIVATTNPVTVVPGDPAQAFNYGDFAITSLKEWMDAVMTRIREVTGSSYWYTDSALLNKSPNLFDVWYDSVGSVMTGSGYLAYNLILEATTPTYGAFQSQFTDSTIGVGDSYVEGQISGNKATVSSFNLTQLIINSLIKQSFNFDETLYNRRIFRPNLALSSLDDGVISSNRVAVHKAIPQSIGAASSVSSWSFTVLSGVATITLNVASHTFKPGDSIAVAGLNCSTNQPNGGFIVKNVTATTIVYDTAFIPTGSPTVSSATVASCTLASHPYLAKFSVTEWDYLSTTITLAAPNHTFVTGDEILVAGIDDSVDGTHIITVNPDTTITFTVAIAPVVTPVVTNLSRVQLRKAQFTLTVSGATPIDYNLDNITAIAVDETEILYILGSSALPSLPSATGAIKYDGVVAISTVSNPVSITGITYGTTPIVLSGSTIVSSDVLTVSSTSSLVPTMVVTGAGIAPSTTILNILSPTTVQLSSPALLTGSGSYSFASPYIEITCAVPHGYQTIVGPIAFTIYGNTSDSPYITTYSQVSLINISSNIFRLVGASIFNGGTYVNAGDPTFARYPSNPYPGPVQWTSDIIVKGIIGERYVRIAQTATATGTDVANKFNINGQTGTAYLQDGEVAYINLERNRSVALGSNYSTSGGASAIIGSAAITDDLGAMLRIGDFLKFADEDESKWLKISNEGYPTLNEGDLLPPASTIVYLITDSGQAPSLTQRPAKSGKLVYCRGTYDEVIVKKHIDVDGSPDIYWIAVRRDNGSLKSKVYLKSLELEPGEVRAINDNEPSNLLIYTGAGNEAAINPNYTAIDSTGEYQATEQLEVGSFSTNIDTRTRTITFVSGPALGFQVGDKVTKVVGPIVYTYTIESLINSITVVMKEDVSTLSPSDTVTYRRINYTINDSDNLTLAIRKEDRELAKVNTALTRPIYDESVYPVLITLTANSLPETINVADTDPLNADQILAGSYIYLGANPNNPSGLAFVLHGTKTMSERIESSLIGMPGGKFSANKILVHIVSGSFPDGAVIMQPNRPGITRQVVNPGNAAFPSTILDGAANIEIVLPPNRRTQVVGSSYVTWPAPSVYKASQDPSLSGEDLMVIANDTVRESSIDYIETFGGPKAKIQIVRTLPLNSRLRFRILPAYGSALSKLAGNVTLQIAYDGGNQIDVLTGRPVYIKSISRDVALKVDGKIEIDALILGVPQPGIIPATDKAFDIGTEALKPNETWTSIHSVKTHNSHPLSAAKTLTFAGTSVGNSGSVLSGANITIPLDHALHVIINLVARRSDGTFGVSGFRTTATYYRDNTGVYAAGSPYTMISGTAGDGYNYAALFGIVGNDIVPVVYGNGVVEWAGKIEYQLVGMPA